MTIRTPEEAEIVENLRQAAREHPEVYKLLFVLDEELSKEIVSKSYSPSSSNYLQVAQSAFAFCQLDARREEENNG